MLYKSQDDPQIEKDLAIKVALYEAFEKKWKKDTRYLTDEKILLKVFQDYEKVVSSPKTPYWYFSMLTVIETGNTKAFAQLTKIQEALTRAQNKIVFFDLAVCSIAPTFQKKFLASPILKPYRYALTRAFLRAKHVLSEREEQMANLLSAPGYTLWVDGVEKFLSNQVIEWKGARIGLGQAGYTLPTLTRPDRQKLYKKIVEAVKPVVAFAESEINAVFTEKKVLDELKGYPHAYSEMIFENENDEHQIIQLAKTVTDHFPIVHRFYRLKKKLLKITGKLEYVDISARIGEVKKNFDFESAIKIVRTAFGEADPFFSGTLDRYLENGQIDVFPKIGKQSGAFCASAANVPTFVMLNHIASLDGVKTLAHEMGHAIHAEFSKSQPILYQAHTISTAEVASTLFENFAFDEVFKTLSDKEKIIALHDSIQDSIATIFRQIMGFNFERDLHVIIRAEGFVAHEKISQLMNKHFMSYLGNEFKLNPEDGLFWIRWSHIRRFFYVYTYAYGELISKAMYAKYKEDASFVEKIKQFMAAGGSKTPEEIFKDIGIDTSKEAFWKAGLTSIEDDIIALEKLVGMKGKK